MEQQQGKAVTGADLRQHVRVLRTFWRSITCVVLVVVICSYGWVLTQEPKYSATASGLVITAGAENTSLALSGDSLAKSRAVSYGSIAATRAVADRVGEMTGNELSAESLLSQIEVTAPTGTAEVRVTATSSSPELARDIANSWIKALSTQAEEIETGLGNDGDASIVKLIPLVIAELPDGPVSPNVKLSLALGVVVGLAFGLGYALLRNHLDRRVRSVSELESLGTAVIGTVPLDPRLVNNRAAIHDQGGGREDKTSYAFAESLRELRTNLTYVDVDRPVKSLLVTSSIPGEGKSSVAANLAIVMAASGRRTVLIDADLRRPVIADMFNLPGGAGLTDVLSRQASLDEVLQPYGPAPELSILAAGRIPPNPSELLGSQMMLSLLDDLREEAFIIIDTPPTLPATDAAVLSNFVDGVIVVIKAESTSSDEVTKTLANFNKIGAHVVGFVLNQVPTKASSASKYGYYGQHYYSSREYADAERKANKKSVIRRFKKAEPDVRTDYQRKRSSNSHNSLETENREAVDASGTDDFDDLVIGRVTRRELREH